MRADKLHGIYSQKHRARQQHLILGVPTEAVQAAPRLRLDHHVDCVLAARPILVAHRAGREIVADIRRLSLSEQLKELRHRVVSAERIEVVVPVHRPFVDRQLLLRRLDDRDARHRQPTQIERIPQVLFRQIVDGHEIPRLFYRLPQRELFLYSPLILCACSRTSSSVTVSFDSRYSTISIC